MYSVRNRFLCVIALLLALIMSGCFGGGSNSGPTKKYSLEVTVVKDSDGQPLAGAAVELVGKGFNIRTTNDKGVVSFSELSGKVEILVQFAGFETQSKELTMNKDQKITLRLLSDEGSVIVQDEAGLNEALADPETASIHLSNDLELTQGLIIAAPIRLNLNGKKLSGDVVYDFVDDEYLELSGSGEIDGNLTIIAPNATISNKIKVSGTIIIEEVGQETWHEYYHNNTIEIRAPYSVVNIYNGAKLITISENNYDVRVNIIGGTVQQFVADASVRVTGANRISHATVNSFGVTFDLSPKKVSGEYEPEIIQSFKPGSGGTIQAFSPSILPPDTFAGLYIDRNHRWTYSFGGSDHPEIDLYFPTPESLGGEGYILQHWDSDVGEWKQFNEIETKHSNQDNFSFSFYEETKFRLLMTGGPFDGYTSNEVEAIPSKIKTYFSSWGMFGLRTFVGETNIGHAEAKRTDQEIVIPASHLYYQWYRVDPVTFEMEKIAGATNTSYTITAADAGYRLLLRATGDNVNIGGFIQIWATSGYRPMLHPNKAFLTEVTHNGFVLNLHKKVPGLSKEQLEVIPYGSTIASEVLDIISVTPLNGSQCQFFVEVDIPLGTESLWVEGHAENWGIVGNYVDENLPYIREAIEYYF